MATCCCLFGSLSCKFEKPIVVVTTASGGSLVFLYGKQALVSVSMETLWCFKKMNHLLFAHFGSSKNNVRRDLL